MAATHLRLCSLTRIPLCRTIAMLVFVLKQLPLNGCKAVSTYTNHLKSCSRFQPAMKAELQVQGPPFHVRPFLTQRSSLYISCPVVVEANYSANTEIISLSESQSCFRSRASLGTLHANASGARQLLLRPSAGAYRRESTAQHTTQQQDGEPPRKCLRRSPRAHKPLDDPRVCGWGRRLLGKRA